MPLPLTVSCFSKIQIGFTFLVPADLGSPGKRAVKRVCVCVYTTASFCSVLRRKWRNVTRSAARHRSGNAVHRIRCERALSMLLPLLLLRSVWLDRSEVGRIDAARPTSTACWRVKHHSAFFSDDSWTVLYQCSCVFLPFLYRRVCNFHCIVSITVRHYCSERFAHFIVFMHCHFMS